MTATEEERRTIIARVGRGELTPDQALELLDELEAREARESVREATARESTEAYPPPTHQLPPPRPAGSSIRCVRVDLAAGKAHILGDPSITGVEAEGPYEMRQDGDTLTVECTPLGGWARQFGEDLDEDDDDYEHGFVMLGSRHGPWHGRRPRLGLRLPPFGGERRAVRVRANPNLELRLDVAAGSASVDGMTGPIEFSVSGGSARLRGVRGPISGDVSAGSVSLRGAIREGTSRLNCSMGGLSIVLDPGSDVRIRARTTMGKASIHAGVREGNEWIVGEGTARLKLDGSMSSISVTDQDVDDDDDED